jgi:hypothetical protein
VEEVESGKWKVESGKWKVARVVSRVQGYNFFHFPSTFHFFHFHTI